MFIFSFKQQVLNEQFSPVSFLSDLYLYSCTCTRRISLLLVQGFQNSVPLLEIQQANNKCMERTSKEVSFSVKFTTLGSRVVVFLAELLKKRGAQCLSFGMSKRQRAFKEFFERHFPHLRIIKDIFKLISSPVLSLYITP